MAARGSFDTRLGFILAAAGSAVGLGNIWKFPFEVGDGGGAAFVIVYLAFCFILCYPVLVTEIAIGRKTQRNPVGAFKALGYKKWSIIGYMGLASGVLILSFYNVVAAWSFGYVIEMIQGNFGIGEDFGVFITDALKVGLYGVIFMSTTAFIVSNGVSGGIERAAKILMPSLIFIILCLLAYALTLPNAMEGVKFYLVPDFSKLTGDVIYSALGQAFFSLSLGMGALITYGSYVSRDQNIVSAGAMITLADVGIAFIAGFMLFPIVFSQGIEPSGGAGLIFITLPGVFETLGPNMGVAVGVLFFLLLTFAALTSTVSLLEVPTAYVVDEHGVERKKAVWGLAFVIFLIGIPSLLSNGTTEWLTSFIQLPGHDSPISFMDFVEDLAADSFLPVGGFLIAVFAAWVWRKENLNEELAYGDPSIRGGILLKYINFAISYICPLMLGLIAVVTILDRFLGIQLIG
ncbi:sodium-dependent transporter [Pleionea mediterranea]|uniref:NSS family neurotransmitter:Na+ symporter n=1 Tax=Pleionea mediterranea TaxID=523701 RepID=A0A316FL39_9GAMM|nr:sodium-dependent transporter [Pleionea mediterranea]PWK49229.1 NSS family neurotransmitter:Na+ symporter [Pleionea mediterranea]